jgi:hypothetical protein
MAHRDGFPGALVPEALTARLGQRPVDVHPSATAGSDASVDARPALVADAGPRALAGVGVEKSAGPVWGALARDARQSAGRVVPAWVAALYKQDAARFAEQSSAAAVWLEVQAWAEPPKLVQPARLAAQPEERQLVQSILSARWPAELVARRDVAARRRKGPQALPLEHSASPQAEQEESPGARAVLQPDEPHSGE